MSLWTAAEAAAATGGEAQGDWHVSGVSIDTRTLEPGDLFVALSAATMLWWLFRLIRSGHHRLHATCHAVMAAGMGVMLVLMNG